jgi:hypothetical protein
VPPIHLDWSHANVSRPVRFIGRRIVSQNMTTIVERTIPPRLVLGQQLLAIIFPRREQRERLCRGTSQTAVPTLRLQQARRNRLWRRGRELAAHPAEVLVKPPANQRRGNYAHRP